MWSVADGWSEQSGKDALNATGDAPIYAARAWVNFNGASTTTTAATYTRVGTAVTINFGTIDPGYKAGDYIYVDFTTGTAVDGLFQLLTFGLSGSDYVGTFTHGTSGSTSGNAQTIQQPIKASGNVSSIAFATNTIYECNFITALTSVNYVLSGSHGNATSVSANGYTLRIGAPDTNKLTTSCKIVVTVSETYAAGNDIGIVFHGG